MTHLFQKSDLGSNQEVAKYHEFCGRMAASGSVNGLTIAIAQKVRSHFHPNDNWHELPSEEREEWKQAVMKGVGWLARVTAEISESAI